MVIRDTGMEQASTSTATHKTGTRAARKFGEVIRDDIRATPNPARTASENPTRMTANAGMRSARNGARCAYKNRYIRPWNPSVRSTANTRPRAYAARVADQGGHRATAASVTATSPGNNRRSIAPNRSADHPYSLLVSGAAR